MGSIDDFGPGELSRRGLLGLSGALVFAIGAGGLASVSRADDPSGEIAPNGWLRIGRDGEITIIYPLTEMGQGSSTALPLILAEELDAAWDDVMVEQLDRDDRAYGNPLFGNVLYTAGSTGVRAYFTPLRLAGAQARRMLIATAARHWEVDPAELETEPSVVRHPASGRALTYGELVGLWDATIEIPEIGEADLKSPADYRYIGEDVPRRDSAAITTGAQLYAIDVSMPDMAFAAVLRAPVEGETPVSLNNDLARNAAGVVDVVTLPDGVAVVADSYERALSARDLLEVTWSETAPARDFDSEADLSAYADAARDLARPGAVWAATGDASAAIAGSDRAVERVYLSDYAYHAQLEPMAAVASVDPDGKGAEVWAGTQSQTLTTLTVTRVLDTTPDRVRLNMMTMGGGFGRRTALMQEYVRDALLASKATGRPVKVVWTREDDVKTGALRPAAAQHLSAGLGPDGRVSGWRHRVAAPSVIEFFNPVRWEQVKPKDIITMKGADNPFYDLPDLLAEHVVTRRGARLSPWRGIGASYTIFAAEAFMDELAHEAGRDPVELRRSLLADNPRGQAVLSRVLEMSAWTRQRKGSALGLALGHYGPSQGALVVEVELDEDSGLIAVTKVWGAFDAGLIVTPDNALNQLEGGVVYGISSALKEWVTISGGVIEQSNFYDYEILRANEMPEISVELLQVDAPPTGIGELSTPMVAPAIANAVFALTLRRLRHMPFTPDRVLEALGTPA
ncbi:MAG: molybdopterin cofactor-binding domain-containing protein [Pseudomonadota bacterium]